MRTLLLLLLVVLSAGCLRSSRFDASSFKQASLDYISEHGLEEYWDVYYALFGTKPDLEVTEANLALVRSAGLTSPKGARLKRDEVREMLPFRALESSRAAVLEMVESDQVPLGKAQRLFLEWHFQAPDDYGSLLETAHSEAVIGWNHEAEFEGKQDLYTFGLIGCTFVAALAPDGSAYLFHQDNSVYEKLEGMIAFLKEHPKSELYVVGHAAYPVAQAISEQVRPQTLRVAVKKDFLDTSLTVHLERTDDGSKLYIASRPVSEDYIPSIHNGDYGNWFCHGRFGQIFPPKEEEFERVIPESYSLKPGG